MKPTLVLNTLNMFSGDHTNTTTTLTPTTLKHITQLFDSDNCLESLQQFESSGFVPPLPPPSDSIPTILSKKPIGNSYCGGTTTIVTPIKEEPVPMLSLKEEQYSSDYSDQSDEEYEPQPKRRMQSRKPTTGRRATSSYSDEIRDEPMKGKRRGNMKNDYDGLAPSERQRLILRRERNKQAAARCRKRREDLTHSLMQEVKMWEGKKDELEEEIRLLRSQKEELEYILQVHQATCSLNQSQQKAPAPVVVAVKSEPGVIVEPANAPYMITEQKRRRPASLNIPFASGLLLDQTGPEGVLIETPSTVIPSFESFLNSGLTPLVNLSTPVFYSNSSNLNTPIVPSCSTQQRSTVVPDLNTPGETVSLVSL